jgi:geranylgeranyl diphosphate synthase, type II
MDTEQKSAAVYSLADVFKILHPYQRQIENQIQEAIDSLGPKTKLRDACEYALLNGGKRFRPALVYMVAKALGHHTDVHQAAMAVEFFHTASLIADDLPCMDNDDKRRNKPSLHKAYDEATALLATYALISAGYECLAKSSRLLKNSSHPQAQQSDDICLLALENVSLNTGLLGATGGQYIDIYPPDLSLETLKEVIQKKTVTLFELSFVLGWLFGGGDPKELELVKKAAYHFGMAFQIADDIGDMAQDLTKELQINIACAFGKEKAKEMLQEELSAFKQVMQKLNLANQEFDQIVRILTLQESDVV